MSKNIESYSAAAESGNFYERRSRWSKLRLAARTSPYTARFGLIVIAIYVFVAMKVMVEYYFQEFILMNLTILVQNSSQKTTLVQIPSNLSFPISVPVSFFSRRVQTQSAKKRCDGKNRKIQVHA